jgi:hypothetical protein
VEARCERGEKSWRHGVKYKWSQGIRVAVNVKVGVEGARKGE